MHGHYARWPDSEDVARADALARPPPNAHDQAEPAQPEPYDIHRMPDQLRRSHADRSWLGGAVGLRGAAVRLEGSEDSDGSERDGYDRTRADSDDAAALPGHPVGE